MTVYVDNARHPYRGMRMSHMMADSTLELTNMADRIGLKQQWIQHQGTDKEHFDVSASKRALAVQLGAVEVSGRELAILMRQRREERANEHKAEIEADSAPDGVPGP